MLARELKIIIDVNKLFSTSANKSGKAAASKVENIVTKLLPSVDYVVVDDGVHEYTSPPSTIIDVTDSAKIKSVRPRALSGSEFEKIL